MQLDDIYQNIYLSFVLKMLLKTKMIFILKAKMIFFQILYCKLNQSLTYAKMHNAICSNKSRIKNYGHFYFYLDIRSGFTIIFVIGFVLAPLHSNQVVSA